MKKPPDNPEFARFTAAMKTIMKVPKTAVMPEKPKSQKGYGDEGSCAASVNS